MCGTIMCFKHVMLKRDSGRCFTYKWNPKIEFLHEFSENYKLNWQGMVHANFISHVNVHPCAKFYVIRTMLGELMVMHDHRLTSYLNFESGRIGRERLFLRIYYF